MDIQLSVYIEMARDVSSSFSVFVFLFIFRLLSARKQVRWVCRLLVSNIYYVTSSLELIACRIFSFQFVEQKAHIAIFILRSVWNNLILWLLLHNINHGDWHFSCKPNTLCKFIAKFFQFVFFIIGMCLTHYIVDKFNWHSMNIEVGFSFAILIKWRVNWLERIFRGYPFYKQNTFSRIRIQWVIKRFKYIV